MRVLRVLWVGLVVMLTGPAWAEDAAPLPEADRQVIEGVIRDQMAAFRRDDAPAAFGFAAPNIQAMFDHDPARFLGMVRNAYQPVYRPRSTAFGVTETAGGRVVQHVEVEGPDGVARTALYSMEHEADGTWRISGCMLTESANVGA